MDTAFLITAFVTLFVIMDPLGMTPLFLALTRNMDKARRRRVALRACLTGAAMLTSFAAFGEQLLSFAGISLSAFRIAGGLLLFLTALEMLFERRSKRREDRAGEDENDDPSIFPLAIPLISGPGAITSVILLYGQRPDWTGFGMIVGVMLTVILLVYLCFLSASLFERLLGKTGIIVLTRVFGMLLAALAVQFVLDGIKGFGFGV